MGRRLFTKGGFWFRNFHAAEEDLALMRKHGMDPLPALSTDGQRFLMSGAPGAPSALRYIKGKRK